MLTPEAYFKRYGEHLAECENPKEAWDRTERDFARLYSTETQIARRFITYPVFQDAHCKYRRGHVFGFVKVHFIDLTLYSLSV